MVNIKVAVRIRPLSERELLLGEEIVVRKENKSVLVTNPKGRKVMEAIRLPAWTISHDCSRFPPSPEHCASPPRTPKRMASRHCQIPERQDGDSRQRTRRFFVDFCYDPKDPETCSQESVYKEIGSEVLDSMYKGYNACVLAYGHSASGKTYTIMGLQDDPGLTPRLCEGLFERIHETCADGRIRVQVVVSFLEIYNEKVRDLLGGEDNGAPSGNFSLRVREHPKLGPYVQGLSEHSVTKKEKLLELLAAGNRRRSTAATENNVHSSRSHALFTIQFRQSDGENYDTEKYSKVHLVDLAGSLQQEFQNNERASSSQSKVRLQEGANINKSLVTLGNVISALAESYDSGILLREHSNPKTWQPFVPYRDSVLTWLLKDTLGGNSNTIMIATVSPASGCLSETVNTLRYAKRTKKIVNQPVVNEDPKIRTIRELRKEVARLKDLLLWIQSCGPWENPFEESLFEESIRFERPESKWLEPEGTQVTVKDDSSAKGNWGRSTEEDPTCEEEIKSESSDRKRRRAPSGGGAAAAACEVSDEKKSDVNGSVNDNFSHETQIFSDSLESFSSVFFKSGNSFDGDDDVSGNGGDDARQTRDDDDARNPPLTRDFASCENLKKKDFPEMLHRSRPDLIKGISTRSKDGLPLGSSQSGTDVSNLSHSTSENSLNSSGSASDTKTSRNLRRLSQPEVKNGKRHVEIAPKKKEKRLEIVEAVTSRLYVTKKKPEQPVAKVEVVKKEEDDDGELEELKLCKRARMKLFDLSRKLAMTRKLKKTVDNDTQTESMTATLRVKEKCVTTDEVPFEAEPPLEEAPPKEEKKPCLIMNQVFIPRSSNYVVECGKVVRIEPPETSGRQETATQTTEDDGRYKNANTSPIKMSPRDEDCFSEDSLDLEMKTGGRPEEPKAPEPETCYDRAAPNFEIYFSPEKQPQKSRNLLNGWTLGEDEHYASGNNLTKDDNQSSDNSFTSVEGTETNSSSESSEDFVFYQTPKDVPSRSKTERELYTITENSEQSDPSDAFSPVQSRSSSLRPQHEGEENRKSVKTTIEQLKPETPKSVSLSPPENPERVPNTTAGECRKSINWTDLQSHKQYLNLNISGSSKVSPFSIDTQLFGKVSKTTQSETSLSASADSITFVFMGPAKPKTSVLMEIIGRSLGRSSLTSETRQRKSRSRGVQCDSGLMRSVSVDTAMIALSRIARNQEPTPEMQRTASLETFTQQDVELSGRLHRQRENGCQCDFEREEKRKSIGTNTNPEMKNKETETEKPKKSVSWFAEEESSPEMPEFGLKYRDFAESEVEESNERNYLKFPEFPERRVRFQPETLTPEEDEISQKTESVDNLTAFLKEATQLLKSINSRSSKHRLLPENPGEERREENRKCGLKRSKKTEMLTRSRTESCLEKDESWRLKGINDRKADENLTWPRRRPTTGKPPTGVRPRVPRSPLTRFDSPHSNGYSSLTRTSSQSSRAGSSGQSWNLSNLSVALSNSCLGEPNSRPPSSRSSHESKWSRDSPSPRSNVPKLNFESVSDLETDLEECCRRLEMAAEQDELREKFWENKKTGCVHESGPYTVEQVDNTKEREVVKRRKTGDCAGGCCCSPSKKDPCKHLWSKGCRSTFELDSFGPGSSHCSQLCMFCRKKETETYHSAISLNSECTSGLCRLNSYGYCPCSPVKLKHVVLSPRAYMQHLLALRRRIVKQTQFDTTETQQTKFCCRRRSDDGDFI